MEEVAGRPWVGLALRVAALLSVSLLLERWILSGALLDEGRYFEETLIPALLARLWDTDDGSRAILFRVGMLGVVGGLLIRAPDTGLAPWASLDGGPVLRLVVGLPVGVLAWAYSTYAYNAYFDQAHLFDRAALIVLAGLALWRPVFVLPFTALTVAIVGQFMHPLGGFSTAEAFLLVRWLLLFSSFFLLTLAGAKVRASDFVFLAFTLLAASYLVAGLGKLETFWVAEGGVGLLLPATHANGWLAFLSAEAVGQATALALRVDGALLAFTLAVECGAAFCLLRRRVFLGFLLAWPAFHLGVFSLTGILFWKWILLEIGLFVVLVARSRDPALAAFQRPHRLIAIPLVVGGTLWFQPVDLTWYNAAVSYVYRFMAVDANGCRWVLPPRYFQPYDYQFTLGAFAYLSPRPALPVTWGATGDRELARTLRSVDSPAEVARLEETRGMRVFDDARARRADDFLRRFVATRNRRPPSPQGWVPWVAPPHLWTSPPQGAWDGSSPVRRVEIVRVTSLYLEGLYQESEPTLLRVVSIPHTSASITPPSLPAEPCAAKPDRVRP